MNALLLECQALLERRGVTSRRAMRRVKLARRLRRLAALLAMGGGYMLADYLKDIGAADLFCHARDLRDFLDTGKRNCALGARQREIDYQTALAFGVVKPPNPDDAPLYDIPV